MANDRVLNTRLRFLTEKADITRARGEIASLERAYEDLEHAQRMNDTIADALTSSLNEQGAAMRRTGAAAQTVTPSRSLTSVEQGRRAGDVGSLFSAVGGLNALGGAGGAFQELGQLGDIVQYIPQAAEGFGQLAASLGTSTTGLIGGLGIAGLALGAVVIALNEYNKGLDAQRAKLAGALKGQEDYYDALKTLTTEQAQERLAQAQRDETIIQQQIAENESALANTFAQAQQTFGDAAARALLATGQLPTGQFEEKLKALRTELGENNSVIARFTQGIQSGVFATNDAIEAEKQLAAAREKATATIETPQSLTDEIQREIDLRTRYGALTTQTAEAELKNLIERQRQLKAEQEVLTAYKPLLEADLNSSDPAKVEAAAIALRRLVVDIPTELGGINNVLLPRAEQLSKYAESISRFTGVGGQLLKGLLSGLEGVAALSDKRAETIAKTQAALDDLAAKNAEKLADIETNRTEQIAAAYENQRETELKAQETFNKAQADAERSYRAEVKRIQRDSNRQLSDAIANRDVLAYKQAQQSRDDQLEDAKNNLKEQQRANREAYNQQLKDAAAAARKQIQLANDAARKQIELANRAYQSELNQRQAALNAELKLIQQAAQAEITLRNQVNSATLAGLNILVNQVKGLFGGSGAGSLIQTIGSVVGAATGSSLISGAASLFGGFFAGGGDFKAGRPIVVGERGAEVLFPRTSGTVMNQQQLAAAGGITFNITGNSRREILRAVDQKLMELFD